MTVGKKATLRSAQSFLALALIGLTALAAATILGFGKPKPALSEEGGGPVEVWAVPAIQKVRPDDQVEHSNLVWTAARREIAVSGAGNEHVPFQIVVTTPPPKPRQGKPMDQLRATVSDLVSQSGTIPADNASIFLEYPVLVYGKSSPVGATGFWPDALVPLTSTFDMSAPFREAVRNRPLWIDIAIPDDAAAGEYKGTVTISRAGQNLATLAIRLQVYGFRLPEDTHLLAYMGVGENQLLRDRGRSDSRDLLLKYHKFLFEHRMEPWFSPLLQPDISLGPDAEVRLNFNEEMYDLYLNRWKTKRVVLETVPDGLLEGLDQDPALPAIANRVQSYVSQVFRRFRENGWTDRLVFNSPIDEPNTAADYEATRKWADLVHRAAPEARFLVTESPVPDNPSWGTLDRAANCFSIHGNQLNRPVVKDAIRTQRKAGSEITWYISCDQQYPQPNYFIDAPAMDPVMVPWITRRYGMNGILYWAINFWSQTADPWTNPVTYLSGFLCSEGWVLNGEGSLVYPGDMSKVHSKQENVDGPVSSIRFELLREGIEDYEYLWLLEHLGDSALADKITESLVVDVSAFSRNVEDLFRARETMARRIEELARK